MGFSLGGVTALCLLRNRPELFEEKVDKVFISSPRLEIPWFAGVLVAIMVPVVKVFLAGYSVGWIRSWIEGKTGVKIPDELALDMWNWASLTRIWRARYNVRDLNVEDNVTGKVDVRLMLCMAGKEPVERILQVEKVMKEKVVRCESVIAVDKIHM